MATITGLTAERMQAIIDSTVVAANVVGGHLILTLSDASTIDAGSVVGPVGAPGSDATVANLSATIPDKVSWKLSGADIVEIWGERIAAGYFIAQLDLLNADSLADWSVRYGDGTQTIVWGGATWTLPGTGAYGRVVAANPLWGAADDQARMKVKGRISGSSAGGSNIYSGFMRTSDGQLAIAYLSDNGHLFVKWNLIGSGAFEEDLGVAIPGGFLFNHYYWVELTRAGNNRTATVYDTDGATVLFTHTGAIPAGAVAIFGAGQSLTPAAGLSRNVGGGHDAELDQIEYYTQQAEAHNLMCAITPASGGVRTVKKIFGSTGSALFKSDFLQTADLAAAVLQRIIDAKGDIIVGSANDLSSRLPVGANGQVLTADSAQALGLKWAAVTPYVQRAILWRNASSGAIANNGGTDVLWDSALSNLDGLWNPASNQDRLTCVTAGLHRVEATIYWGNAGGTRETTLNHYNAAGVLQRAIICDNSPGVGNAAQATGTFEMAVGDYVKVNAWQSSGGSDSFGAANKRTTVAFTRVSS